MESIDPKPPGTEKEFPYQPETVVEKAVIKFHQCTRDELPDSLNRCVYYPNAFEYFRKLDMRELISQYSSWHSFQGYLIQEYDRAYTDGTISLFKYDGKEFLEFPLRNDTDNTRIYAVSVPNKNNAQPWFCSAIRKGGKLNEFATIANVDGWYRILDKMADLASAGITSRPALRYRIEDAFVEAIASESLYRYVHRGDICHEYPLGILSRDGNQQITITFSASAEKIRWKFLRFNYRSIQKPLADEIRREDARLWRKEERELVKLADKQRALEMQEAEWKKREAEKTLIKFESFPLKKIKNTDSTAYLKQITKFAYISPVYLFLPKLGIDLRDDDEVKATIARTFARCNPYSDIDYYEIRGRRTAELRVEFPGHEGKLLYAHFEPNANQQKQPWHLDKIVYGTMFQRAFKNLDYAHLYTGFSKVAGDTAISSAKELSEYLEQEFVAAISSDSLYYYGDPARKRVELPLSQKSRNGNALHLVFALAPDRKWIYAGFRERTGDDVRFCISNEYKKESEEKPQEPAEVIEEEPVIAYTKPVVQKAKEPQFKGTWFPGVDGKPITLADFCKPVAFKKLRQLAEMAEEECWGWRDEEPLELLYKYLNSRFVRLGYERKIGLYQGVNDLDYVAFHTGLFSRDFHEPIFACLKPIPQFSPGYAGPKWYLDGFCCHSEGGAVYDKLRDKFPILPPDADFMRENGTFVPISSYQLDLSQPISLKEEHILKERGYRLPHKFLERAFRLCKDKTALQHLQKLTSLKGDTEQKEFWLNEFSVYLENSQATYEKLLQFLGNAVEEAVQCNVRHPIPAYYPRDNVINWLLPLRFYEETDLKNIVLVVGRREAGGYKGITVMTMEMVYHHARAFANPDSYWLKTEILDNYVIDEGAYNKAEEKDDEYAELYEDEE